MTNEGAIRLLSEIGTRAVDDVYALRERGAIIGSLPAAGFWTDREPLGGYRGESQVRALIEFIQSRSFEGILRIKGIDHSSAMRQLGFGDGQPRFDRDAEKAKRPDQRSAFEGDYYTTL